MMSSILRRLSFAHPLSLRRWCHWLCVWQAEKLSSSFWGGGGGCPFSFFAWCCRHLVVAGGSTEWRVGVEGSKWGRRQLFIPEPGDNVTHDGRPWCNRTGLLGQVQTEGGRHSGYDQITDQRLTDVACSTSWQSMERKTVQTWGKGKGKVSGRKKQEKHQECAENQFDMHY